MPSSAATLNVVIENPDVKSTMVKLCKNLMPAPHADARSSPCQQLKSSTKALMMCTMIEIVEMIEMIQVVEMLEIIEKDAPGFPARPKRPTLHMHTNAI